MPGKTRPTISMKVIHFLFSTTHRVGILDGQVGSADHDLIEEREDQHDPSILVLKEKFVVADGLAQFGVIEHQVRAFGGANIMRWQAQAPVRSIDPGTGRVDHQAWCNIKILAAHFIF